MDDLALTSRRLFAICWLTLWRGLVGWAVIWIGVLIVLILVWKSLGRTTPPIGLAVASLIAVAAVWWPVVLRMALRKKYKDFRIALVAPESNLSVFD